MMVLVVDDNLGTLNAIRTGLISHGYQALTAGDGNTALRLMRSAKREHRPLDLLLTDIRMPRMDGFRLISLARDIYPDLPVILMTAYGDDDFVRQKLRKIEGCGYIDKPFRPETLSRLIMEEKDRPG